jgi:cytidylate kinase
VAGGKQVVFLSGPIGVGKSTIGAAVSLRLGCAFIQSDALSDPGQDWYEQIEAVNAAIIQQCLTSLMASDVVVVELPLDGTRWRTFRAAFEPQVQARCITLAADYAAIVAPVRGRVFARWELGRVKEMIAEGYNSRDFSDAIVQTDVGDLDVVVNTVLEIIGGQSA